MPSAVDPARPVVAIAGATGFVGRHLGRRLRERAHVVGLSRVQPRDPGDAVDEWRACDLLGLRNTERAMEGAEYAYYLVHSMMPSARLTQGDFWDFDLIVADNFARAARRAGVKQIVYLGGIVPGREILSHHLTSRFEVEQALRAYGVPVTTLRAGLVVGAEGSSFLAMARTLERLPAVFCPPWADTLSHPVALRDAVELLAFCLGDRRTFGETFDIGGPEVMSYRTMMTEIATALGMARPAVRLPVGHTRTLQFFVSLVSGAPRELIEPLIESLRYPIVARERSLNAMAGLPGTSFTEAVREAVAELRRAPGGERRQPIAFQRSRTSSGASTVRSVQRFVLPAGRTAEWVAREYLAWLPRGLAALVRVEARDDRVFTVSLRFLPRRPLLVLQRVEHKSWPDRWLFSITGGLLAQPGRHQRIEFREVLGKRHVLVALQDFKPRLPWLLYLLTQARLHLWVMRSFARHLARADREAGPSAG